LPNSGAQYELTDDQISALVNAFSASLDNSNIDPLTGEGHIDWSYSLTNSDVDFLSEGDEFSFTYDVVIHDNGSAAAGDTVASITVNVVGTNDDPVVTSTGEVTNLATTEEIVEGTSTASLSSVLLFTDVDLGDSFNITVSNESSNGSFYGTLLPLQPAESPLNSGVFQLGVNYQISAADSPGLESISSLAEGEVVTETYTVTITDIPGGGSVTRPIVVTLTGSNDNPEITFATGNDEGALESLLTLDTAVGETLIADGAETADLGWTFTGTASDFDYLADGETLEIEYTIEVSDDNTPPGLDTQTVTRLMLRTLLKKTPLL